MLVQGEEVYLKFASLLATQDHHTGIIPWKLRWVASANLGTSSTRHLSADHKGTVRAMLVHQGTA